MTTGLVFTVSASRDDEQHSPPSTAKTAITWTANENRQLFINPKCNLTNYVQEASTEYRIQNTELGTRNPQPATPNSEPATRNSAYWSAFSPLLESVVSPSACELHDARCSWGKQRGSTA